MCQAEGFNTEGCYPGIDGLKERGATTVNPEFRRQLAPVGRGEPSWSQELRPLRRGPTWLPCHSEEGQ